MILLVQACQITSLNQIENQNQFLPVKILSFKIEILSTVPPHNNENSRDFSALASSSTTEVWSQFEKEKMCG